MKDGFYVFSIETGEWFLRLPNGVIVGPFYSEIDALLAEGQVKRKTLTVPKSRRCFTVGKGNFRLTVSE